MTARTAVNETHAPGVRETVSDVLVVAGFGSTQHGSVRTDKIRAHLQPLALATREVTYISPCRDPGVPAIEFRSVGGRSRLFRILNQFVYTLASARNGRYEAIISFSLIPYGLIALLAKTVSGRPAHLGIIGMDLDVHASSWYGWVIRWLFRRFDTISVASSIHRQRLLSMGVPADRVFVISHPVDEAYVNARRMTDPTYDLLWIGRMSREKDPIRFVTVVRELVHRGVPCRAAMVGDGPLLADVRSAVTAHDLEGVIDVPGWSDDPISWYEQSRLFVSTAEREMLPLTIVEAMAVGVPPVAPAVGGIPDVVSSPECGVIVRNRDSGTYADAIAEVLVDPARLRRMSAHAQDVGRSLTIDAVARSWIPVLDTLSGR